MGLVARILLAALFGAGVGTLVGFGVAEVAPESGDAAMFFGAASSLIAAALILAVFAVMGRIDHVSWMIEDVKQLQREGSDLARSRG